jgi:uncharacterized protein (TIGR02246 family)
MKKFSLLLAIAFAGVSCTDHNIDAIDLQQEGDAIKKLVTVTYRDALAASNADGVTSAFTGDGVVMGPASPTASGSTQLKSTYDGIFGAVGLDLTFKIDEMIVGKEYGFVRSTSAGTLTVKANGATAPEENREVFIVKKADDQWKIARYLYNKMGTLSQAIGTDVIENKASSYTEADRSAINSLITATYSSALASSDAAAVSGLFVTDGVLMAPDAPTMKGAAAIKTTYESVFSATKLNLAFTIDEIVIDGEYGYVRSHSGGTTLINATSQTVPASYREIFVVKKVDGVWKIAWYAYNQPS